MAKMSAHIGRGNTSKVREGFIPNPKLKLLDQVSEVMRFKHYSIRTEGTYRDWLKRFIFFHGKRHPRAMGAEEVGRFLSCGRCPLRCRIKLSTLCCFFIERCFHQEWGE